MNEEIEEEVPPTLRSQRTPNRPFIVGISGKRGTGKDSLAEVLVRRFDFIRIGFADPMKRFLKNEFEFTDEELNGPSELREKVDPRFGKSPREMLQTLGTEWGRRLVHTDIWVRLAVRQAQKAMASGAAGVVISDVRFPNELDGLRDAGAYLVRIRRQGRSSSLHDAHESETALDGVDDSAFFATMQNDGDLVDLEFMCAEFVRAIRKSV